MKDLKKIVGIRSKPMRSEDERFDRCKKCKFAHYVYSFDNWRFVGCSELKWKWVIEIENCPLQEDN